VAGELKLNPKRCHLFMNSLVFPYHVVSDEGVMIQSRGDECSLGIANSSSNISFSLV